MSEQVPTKDLFSPGTLVWWRYPGGSARAKVVRASKSGKRIKIEYKHHPSWTAGREVTEWTYVMPKNLERRHE